MNRNRIHRNGAHRNDHAAAIVHVTFSHPEATVVAIAGTFNDWRPEATPMVPLGEGQWRKDLSLPPGSYEYLLVADGEWLADPKAEVNVPNPFGGVNSVITVPDHQPGNGATKRQK